MKKSYRMSSGLMKLNILSLAVITLVTAGFLAIITIPIALISFVNYKKNKLELTSKSIILQKGWLNTSQVEIPFTKINSVSVKQDFLGNLIGYGDIAILTGNDVTGEVFKGIDNPKAVKEAIMKRVDKK